MSVIHGKGNTVAGKNIVVSGNGNIVIRSHGSVNGTLGGIVGNGKVKAERRTIDRISRIILNGPVSLLFSRGATPYFRVTADDNIPLLWLREFPGIP